MDTIVTASAAAEGPDERVVFQSRGEISMSDILTEIAGCELLARLFKSRGYAVKRNLTFREYGVSFHIDGWDAKRRVGFEFLTSEDDDHDDLTLAEYQTLMVAQQRGELALFIIDEVEPLSAEELRATANSFLDEVEAALAAARRPRKKTASAGTRAAGRNAVRKKATRKGVSTKKKATKSARRSR
jgi:hypothetical protein